METLGVGWSLYWEGALDHLALAATLFGVLGLMAANAAATQQVFASALRPPAKMAWLAAIWVAPIIGLGAWAAAASLPSLRSKSSGSPSPGRS